MKVDESVPLKVTQVFKHNNHSCLSESVQMHLFIFLFLNLRFEHIHPRVWLKCTAFFVFLVFICSTVSLRYTSYHHGPLFIHCEISHWQRWNFTHCWKPNSFLSGPPLHLRSHQVITESPCGSGYLFSLCSSYLKPTLLWWPFVYETEIPVLDSVWLCTLQCVQCRHIDAVWETLKRRSLLDQW